MIHAMMENTTCQGALTGNLGFMPYPNLCPPSSSSSTEQSYPANIMGIGPLSELRRDDYLAGTLLSLHLLP